MKDTLHLKAPGNWINDPNGFIYYQGEYHLFYQHFPYAPRWGTMHWGHAVSKDLVHWEHVGIALFPTKEYDSNGCFSGSALEVDGKLQLYYTAVKYKTENAQDIHVGGDDGFLASQAMITSVDGRTFDNWKDKNQIIPVLQDGEYGSAQDTRDPKVWEADGRYYMILGSRDNVCGKVLFYSSDDARKWHYLNQYQTEKFGEMLECPDLFALAEGYMFIGSPMNVTDPGVEYTSQAMYGLVDFVQEDCSMKLQGELQYLDYGLDFYAPQTTSDANGRRVMIGWMRMPKLVDEPADRRGAWNGIMTMPRVIEQNGKSVCFRVHPQVDAAFTHEVVEKALDVHKPFRVKTALAKGDMVNIGGYRIWWEDGCICTDRSRVFADLKGYRMTAQTPQLARDAAELDIFVDGHLIEIFVDGGAYVISHIVYDLNDTIQISNEHSIWTMEG